MSLVKINTLSYLNLSSLGPSAKENSAGLADVDNNALIRKNKCGIEKLRYFYVSSKDLI